MSKNQTFWHGKDGEIGRVFVLLSKRSKMNKDNVGKLLGIDTK